MENLESNAEILCRACLTAINDCEWYSLLNHNILVNQQTYEWKTLAEIYKECTHIRFESTNAQWQWICHRCLQKFVEFYEFQQICINSYARLCEGNVGNQELETIKVGPNIKVENHLETEEDDFSSHGDNFYSYDANFQSDEDVQSAVDPESGQVNSDIYDGDPFSLSIVKQEDSDEFVENSALPTHIASRHYDESNEMKQKELACDSDGCGKVSNTKKSLNCHMRRTSMVHQKKKPAELTPTRCEESGESFKETETLNLHNHTHVKNIPFKCNICWKIFENKNTLEEHKTHHMNIEKIQCKFCPVKISTANNMKRHIRVVHQGVKNCECPYCNRPFSNGEALKYHIMTHTGERPFKCKVCNREFIQPSAFKSHMKVHNK